MGDGMEEALCFRVVDGRAGGVEVDVAAAGVLRKGVLVEGVGETAVRRRLRGGILLGQALDSSDAAASGQPLSGQGIGGANKSLKSRGLKMKLGP